MPLVGYLLVGSGFPQDRADRNVMHCLLCSTLEHTETEKRKIYWKKLLEMVELHFSLPTKTVSTVRHYKMHKIYK